MRAFTKPLSVLCLLLLGACTLVAQDTAASMLRLGGKQERQAVGKKDAARRAELLKAVEIYEKLENTWPEALKEVAQARLRTGEILRRVGRADDALRTLDRALEIEGQPRVHAKAGLAKASILRRKKDLDGAIEALTRIERECATERKLCAQALLAMASIERQRRAWSKAEKRARAVLDGYDELWRENVDAANAVVGVHIRRRAWVEAIDTLKELDRLLTDRFREHAKWESVDRAMKSMSSRRTLTPVDGED